MTCLAAFPGKRHLNSALVELCSGLKFFSPTAPNRISYKTSLIFLQTLFHTLTSSELAWIIRFNLLELKLDPCHITVQSEGCTWHLQWSISWTALLLSVCGLLPSLKSKLMSSCLVSPLTFSLREIIFRLLFG